MTEIKKTTWGSIKKWIPSILVFFGLTSYEAWKGLYSEHIDDKIRDRHVQELLDRVIDENLLERQDEFNQKIELRLVGISDSIRVNRSKTRLNRSKITEVVEDEQATYDELSQLAKFVISKHTN